MLFENLRRLLNKAFHGSPSPRRPTLNRFRPLLEHLEGRTVPSGLTVSSVSPSQWTVGESGFTGTATVSGGTGTGYAITARSDLPTGLTAVISSNTISFTGTPSTAGTYPSGSITVEDSASDTYTDEPISITINPAPTIGILTQTQWTVSQSGFTGTLPISGGTSSYTLFMYSGLPTGMAASISGSNIDITGTPSATGTYSGSVTIDDAAGASATQTFSITIEADPTIGALSKTTWTAGQSGFTGTMAISNGTTPFTITHQSGFPTGLTAVISGSTISFTGTPTTAGTYPSGSITITDTAGASVTMSSISITINPAPPAAGALEVGALTQTQWTVSRAGFTGTMALSGGTTPYSVSAQSGLPTGLTAAISGSSVVFTGTPSAAGAFTSGSITVTDSAGASVTVAVSITINPAPTVSALTTTTGTVAQTFTGTMSIAGGTTPFTISAQSGLPPGLTATVSGTTISFTGTPTTAGTYASGSITITDTAGAQVTKTFSITIAAASTSTAVAPKITSANLVSFGAGVANSFQIQTTGTPSVTSITILGAPSWLKFNSATGVISGIPPIVNGVVAQTFKITIEATNGVSPDATQTLTIDVLEPNRRGAA